MPLLRHACQREELRFEYKRGLLRIDFDVLQELLLPFYVDLQCHVADGVKPSCRRSAPMSKSLAMSTHEPTDVNPYNGIAFLFGRPWKRQGHAPQHCVHASCKGLFALLCASCSRHNNCGHPDGPREQEVSNAWLNSRIAHAWLRR